MPERSPGHDWDDPRVGEFYRPYRLATLTTLRSDGSPHTVPVAAVVDPAARTVRILTSRTSVKARNVLRGATRVTLCEVDGPHWLTVEGQARVVTDPAAITDAVAAYARRFRPPRVNPERVIILVEPTRLIGRLSTGRDAGT